MSVNWTLKDRKNNGVRSLFPGERLLTPLAQSSTFEAILSVFPKKQYSLEYFAGIFEIYDINLGD